LVKRHTSGIRHDYKDTLAASPERRRRRWSLFAFGLSLPLLAVTLLFLGTPQRPAAIPRAEASLEPTPTPPPLLTPAAEIAPEAPIAAVSTAVEPPATLESTIDPGSTMLDLLVKRGDTLELLFRRNGLNLADLAAMVALPDAGSALSC
jgi:hypothetical protein